MKITQTRVMQADGADRKAHHSALHVGTVIDATCCVPCALAQRQHC